MLQDRIKEFERTGLFKVGFVRLIERLQINKHRWLGSVYYERYLDISERNLRKLIRHAIEKGVPIASGNQGYKIATLYSEIEDTVRRIEHHAISELRKVKKLKQAFGEDVQLEMFAEVG